MTNTTETNQQQGANMMNITARQSEVDALISALAAASEDYAAQQKQGEIK